MPPSFASDYLESVKKQFGYYQTLGSRTFAQLSDEELFEEIEEGTNSIAIIVNHLHGNMLSRWTEFLTTDGEKEWRQRDREFEEVIGTRQELLSKWEAGWNCLYQALDTIDETNFDQLVFIRNQGHTITEAVNRQLCHYAYHVGQIVLLGKLNRKDRWESLSIPKGASEKYNAEKFSRERKRGHFTDDLPPKE